MQLDGQLAVFARLGEGREGVADAGDVLAEGDIDVGPVGGEGGRYGVGGTPGAGVGDARDVDLVEGGHRRGGRGDGLAVWEGDG